MNDQSDQLQQVIRERNELILRLKKYESWPDHHDELIALQESLHQRDTEVESWRDKAKAHEEELVQMHEQRRQRDTSIVNLERERDAAIHEANRRDQKWMDGTNEILGCKLDYGDPCIRDNASKALEKWRDSHRTALVAAREALQHVSDWSDFPSVNEYDDEEVKQAIAQIDSTLHQTKDAKL